MKRRSEPSPVTTTAHEQRALGRFIEEVRRSRGMTQQELAQALRTSQSAVARMEKGEQNLGMEMLVKISRALRRDVIRLGTGGMTFRVDGGKRLRGTVRTNTSKNSAVALLCATLLNRGTTTIKRIARIEEVFRILEVLQSIGVRVQWRDGDVRLTPPRRLMMDRLNAASASATRSVLMLLGPLIHLLPAFTLPAPGGCKLGKRSIRPHELALRSLGVRITTRGGVHHVSARSLHPARIVLAEASDTATATALMAAARIPGTTVIAFCSANYQVQDLCFYFEQLGVRIEGIGTTTLTVHGVADIERDIAVWPSEDPIEAMLFLAVAAVTKSSLTIERCPIEFLELELLRLRTMGFRYRILRRYTAVNGRTPLVDLRTYPSKLVAPEDKIACSPYPGLNIDNLPFFAPIATQAKGTTLLHDWVYEHRAVYLLELNKLGASCMLADPHRLTIEGPTPLSAAEIICPPALRPAVVVLIAMLAAKGTSVLRNVYSINRGYEDLCTRLAALGADIRMVPSF